MADRIGQQLGNYRIIRLLGKGGFAEVYLGEHIYLKTPAAIKLLQTKVGNKEDLDAFLKEAQTIARLGHPNIVRVMDFGVDGETPFLVMDYAPNGTLRERHPKGTIVPLPTIISYVKQVADALQFAHDMKLPTIISYVKQVADALQFAHDMKLIHRDIKPENMLVGSRKEILLSDFGIALIAQSSRYQSTQDVVGTVAYMSPEQIQGKPRPASDQYFPEKGGVSLNEQRREGKTERRQKRSSRWQKLFHRMRSPVLADEVTHRPKRQGNGMPSVDQILPYVLPKWERQTVVLVRHPDHTVGPARSTSVKPISDVALSCLKYNTFSCAVVRLRRMAHYTAAFMRESTLTSLIC